MSNVKIELDRLYERIGQFSHIGSVVHSMIADVVEGIDKMDEYDYGTPKPREITDLFDKIGSIRDDLELVECDINKILKETVLKENEMRSDKRSIEKT